MNNSRHAVFCQTASFALNNKDFGIVNKAEDEDQIEQRDEEE